MEKAIDGGENESRRERMEQKSDGEKMDEEKNGWRKEWMEEIIDEKEIYRGKN